ncbi:MAG: hypothetical protein H7061_14630 [Bdellovibrionaceae bacterium]|nr:hypothetical protein [Bdellovibrio sp.]
MKRIMAIILLIGSISNAGIFLRKGMYAEQTDLAIGKGFTLSDAKKDALSAVPKTYRIAKELNSPTYYCIDDITWNENNNCNGGQVNFLLPVIEK